MTALLQELATAFRRNGPFIRVTVIDAQGSTPREKGAAMMVSAREVTGTVGGGALEYDAITHAKALLEKSGSVTWLRDTKDYPLGPSLGQCCGGRVRLLFEKYGPEEVAFIADFQMDIQYFARRLSSGSAPIGISKRDTEESKSKLGMGSDSDWFSEPVEKELLPIFLYGAGHVAREVVRIFEGMAVEIVWIDTDEARFPDPLPAHVKRLIAAAPHQAVAHAPDDAFHIVMSYSHPIDLEICHAVLKRGWFRYLGLIGSMTKRARFLKRLGELGVADADLLRLTCPIGADGPSSKEPAVIAISLAAEILRLAETPQTE